MTDRARRAVLVATLLVAAASLVAAAGTAMAGTAATSTTSQQVDTNASENASAGHVNVTVGAQLSTVIETRSDEVRSEVEETDFDLEFESGDRTEAVAERAAELRERAGELREDFREHTAAFEAGEISRDEYARRIAVLNDRAERIRTALDRLQSRFASLDDRDRERVALNRTEISSIDAAVRNVTGAGPQALLERFTGVTTGELELRVDDGLRIEAESEDGERSREIRRPGDDSLDLAIGQDAALTTARGALSDAPGNWTLVESSVHEEDGQYRFEFALRTPDRTGETEVRVDGSSGDVVRLEEELEPRDDEDDEIETPEPTEKPEPSETPEPTETPETPEPSETPEPEETAEPTETAEPSLDLRVAEGTPGPGKSITVAVSVGGSPAADVPIEVGGDVAGETGDDGRLTVTLPDTDDVRIRAESDGLDDELRFEFEDQ